MPTISSGESGISLTSKIGLAIWYKSSSKWLKGGKESLWCLNLSIMCYASWFQFIASQIGFSEIEKV